MSSISQAVKNLFPIIWVDALEPERVIDSIPSIIEDDRDIYIYDPLKGLTLWNRDSSSWKIVLVKIQDEEGESFEAPITSFKASLYYILSLKPSIFIIRNADVSFADDPDIFSLLSSTYGEFRQTFFKDNLKYLPHQFILLASSSDIPDPLKSMTSLAKWSYPTVSDLIKVVETLALNYREDIIADSTPVDLAKLSLGLTEKDAIETFLHSIRMCGKIDSKVLKQLKFERLKASSSLKIEEPTVKLSDVGGLDNAKKLINTAIWIQNNPEEAEKLGLKPLRRILLLGLSGCGKSFLCEAAANGLNLPLIKTGVSQSFNKFVGESEKAINAMFDQINILSPVAVWIDEIGRDLSGGSSSDYVDGGVTSRVHGTFLTRMQELDPSVFLFAAANDVASLAPEMLRADRFDKLLFVGFPSYEERKEIFSLYLPKEQEYDLNVLAEKTPCFTGAEIKSLIDRTKFEVSTMTKKLIQTSDILSYVDHQKNRIWIRHRSLAVDMYRMALKEYEWASSSQMAEAHAIANGNTPDTIKKSFMVK